MKFTEQQKSTALAIVRIFETSKADGDYAACVVLNDGAGVSYGVSQFTHKSGSLLAVVRAYLEKAADGVVGAAGSKVSEKLRECLPLLAKKTKSAIATLAADKEFRRALKLSASEPEMRAAQDETTEKLYLIPAIKICEEMNFNLPLSLSVIYDSITHGSWEKIRDRVESTTPRQKPHPSLDKEGSSLSEKVWIAGYVRRRDAWLKSIPRLKPTSYRTRFFLDEIARGNWQLELPLTVHGVKLARGHLALPDSAVEAQPLDLPARDPRQPYLPGCSPVAHEPQPPTAEMEGGKILDGIREKVDQTAAKYDQAEKIVTTVVTRKDAAKSLWTTVSAAAWQTIWAVAAFFAGVPRQIWLVVALIVAAFGLFYLYRQIALGKIREKSFLPQRHREDFRFKKEITGFTY